jgi:hypothetical protein
LTTARVFSHRSDDPVDVAIRSFDHLLDTLAGVAQATQIVRFLAHFLLDRPLHDIGQVLDMVGHVGIAPRGQCVLVGIELEVVMHTVVGNPFGAKAPGLSVLVHQRS